MSSASSLAPRLFRSNCNPSYLIDFKPEVHAKCLEYAQPKPVYGALLVPVLSTPPPGKPADEGSRLLSLALPSLRLSFDPSSYKDSKKTTLELDLSDARTHAHVKKTYDVLSALDDAFADALVANRAAWLPTIKDKGPVAITDAQVKSGCYQRMTRPRTSAKSDRVWGPRLTVTLTGAKDVSGNGTGTMYTDENYGLQRGDTVSVLIVCTGLSSRGGKVQPSWRVLQVRRHMEGMPMSDQSLTEKEAYGYELGNEEDGQDGDVYRMDKMDTTQDFI